MQKVDLTKLYIEVTAEFPSFKIVSKSDSLFMRCIGTFLYLCSLGKQNTFMSKYTTTIGNTVYLPTGWETLAYTIRAEILRHERVHMRQAKRDGTLWFFFLYLFAYFPIGYARYRAHYEMEAYEESLRAMHEYGEDITSPVHREWMIRTFTGPAYLWMYPFRDEIELWYDTTVLEILNSEKIP